MRFFWRIEAALANALAVGHDLHDPFALMLGNAQKSGLVGFSWFAYVLQIAKTRYFSKIVKSVVKFVAVNVINVARRPFTSHVQPRQPVRQSFLVVDGYGPVAHVGTASGAVPNQVQSVLMFFPRKIARMWVVVQHRTDMFNCSHDSQFTIGAAK